MKTISIINLKGGVAKTLTADNMAHVLAVFHNKRVLLVDNDKQGNTSKAFGVHSYDEKSLSDILTARRIDPHEVIKKTRFQNIDVLPANMTLIRANLEVMMDSTRPQQTRLRAALGAVTGEYDYCIIDNAPDINISTICRADLAPRTAERKCRVPRHVRGRESLPCGRAGGLPAGGTADRPREQAGGILRQGQDPRQPCTQVL